MNTTEQTKSKNSRLIIICMIVIILLLGGLVVLLLVRGGRGNSAQSVTSSDGSTPKLTYANDGVTIIDDADALQKAVDEMREKAEDSVALLYQPNAYSSDGLTFDCAIGNSGANSYDMFITICADSAFTDQVFLSSLIRPGEQFERITLERTLDPGEHTLYVAFTQVKEDLKTIHSQTLVSMKFIVDEP